MSSAMQGIYRDIQAMDEAAAQAVTTLRMWVVEEVNGLVRLKTPLDVARGTTPMEQRWPRVAGEPFAPDTEVRVERRGLGFYVLGAVQVGAGQYKQQRLGFQNNGATVATGPATLNAGQGITAAASGGGAGVTLTPDYVYVQKSVTISKALAAVKINPTQLEFAAGLLVGSGATTQADISLDYGAVGGTDANQVPRNTDVQRKQGWASGNGAGGLLAATSNPPVIATPDTSGLKITPVGTPVTQLNLEVNFVRVQAALDMQDGAGAVIDQAPTFIKAGAGLAVAADGTGSRLRSLGDTGPRMNIGAPFASWLSVHTTWPTRNATPVTVALVANQLYGTTFRASRRWAARSTLFRVITAGSSIRWACFRLDDDTGMTLTPYFQSGVVSVTTVGLKRADFTWPDTADGTYAFVFVANAAVSLSGMAATGASEGPWVLNNAFDPAASYNTGTAIPTVYGIQRAYTFGDLGSAITLAPADLRDQALPVGWVYGLPL